MPQVFYCPKCKEALSVGGATYTCPGCARKYSTVDGIPSFIDQNITADSFNAAAFEYLFEMERKHFWHVGRKEIILDVIKKHVPRFDKVKMLEVGCGNGSVLDYLKRNSINVEGGDLFIEGLKFCRQKAGPVHLYQIDVLTLPFKEEYEVIGLFDVLEHIEDDRKALSEISRALRPGGYLILTVPAYQVLWSRHDEASHHKRRYSKKNLVAKLENCGFSVDKVTYFMFFLYPMLAAVRLLSKVFRSGIQKKDDAMTSLEYKTMPVINDIFLTLLRLEKYLIRRMDLPFGASLILIARRG
jgi:2-polyprenyl-3-methyl-5-hydroxy-6-metoxy-1,4-benzoquinol methylase